VGGPTHVCDRGVTHFEGGVAADRVADHRLELDAPQTEDGVSGYLTFRIARIDSRSESYPFS
jgi:hypothetical protein